MVVDGELLALGVRVVAFVGVGGIVASRLISTHKGDSLPSLVMGVLVALLLFPFLLYLGAKVMGLRISLSSIIFWSLVIVGLGLVLGKRTRRSSEMKEKKRI